MLNQSDKFNPYSPNNYKLKLIKNGFHIIQILRLQKVIFSIEYFFKITFVAINETKFQIVFMQNEKFLLSDILELNDSRLNIVNVNQIRGYELIDNSVIIEKEVQILEK